MNDMDMIFLYRNYLGEEEVLKFLEGSDNRKEERTMLIEINKKIADSVEEEEFDYWRELRSDFYKKGEKYVREKIEEDKLNGILTESGEYNGR